MTGRFALDIETVSPSLDHYADVPDFSDPRYFELLAVALAHEAPDGRREQTVLFRESGDPGGELELVERTCDWIDARPGDRVVTYGGAGFDVPQLVGRAEAAAVAVGEGAELVERVSSLLREDGDHLDVQPAVWDAHGEYTRLGEACAAAGIDLRDTAWAAYDHGIDLDDRRPGRYAGFRKLLNRDVPVVGERYLALADAGATETVTCRALRDLLADYASEDVAHLFDLADARPFDGGDASDD